MSAAEEEEEKTVAVKIAPEDFERWWARSEELHSVLTRLPSRLVVNAGMQRRRQALLERWDDLEAPGLDDDEIDLNLVGTLRAWIHDTEVLIRYIISTEDTGTGLADAMPAANLPIAPRLEAVETTEDAPAVTEQWHWPWIEGWDDVKKRHRILHPKEKKETSLKRKLIYAALGVGVVYAGARYMDEE